MKFTRHKTYEEIRRQCKKQKLELLDQRYHEGGDCIAIRGGGAHAVYNTFNGHFWGKTPTGVPFSSTTQHHKAGWYQALLRFFYVEKEA